MTNPATIDRRDVAPTTNPIGGQAHVEQIDKPNRATPLDPKAARREPPVPEDTNPGLFDRIRAERHETAQERRPRR